MLRLEDRDPFAIDPRYIFCGSRTETKRDDAMMRRAVIERLRVIPRNITLVVGYNPKRRTPRGADMIVYQEAKKMGFTVETHPAEWELYKKAAGFKRNNKMARLGAQRCIAFWDGSSSGTKDMMDRAALYNIPVEVVPWKKGKKRKQGSTPSK